MFEGQKFVEIMDGKPLKLKDVNLSSEKKHDQLLSHFSSTKITNESEEALRNKRSRVRSNNKDTQQILGPFVKKDRGLTGKEIHRNSPRAKPRESGNKLAPCLSEARKHSFSSMSQSNLKLPKIPLSKVSGETPGTSFFEVLHVNNSEPNDHFHKLDRNKDLVRPRPVSGEISTTAFSTSQERAAIPSAHSSWKIKLHSRCLDISDDEG